MKSVKNMAILSILIGIGTLPAYSKLDGGISKSHFFDTEKTIIEDIQPDTTIKTGKYWEKNLFYANKYRPLFMLSNKELFDLTPKDDMVETRLSTPSVYNISLKTNSIKTISFTQNKKKTATPKIATKPKAKIEKPLIHKNNQEVAASIYEQAKNPEVEPESKIKAAILLKNSKKTSNYLLALDLLDDVTRKEPYNAYAFYLKGELYSIQNSPQSAMKNYVESLKINPTSKQCYIGIAKILELTNKELAQKYYAKADSNEAQ